MKRHSDIINGLKEAEFILVLFWAFVVSSFGSKKLKISVCGFSRVVFSFVLFKHFGIKFTRSIFSCCLCKRMAD